MSDNSSRAGTNRARRILLGTTAMMGLAVVTLGWAAVVAPTSSAREPLVVVPISQPIVVGSKLASAPTPTPTPEPARFGLGVNVGQSVYWSSERTFANLAFAAARWRDPAAGWVDVPVDRITAMGYPKTGGVLMINAPQTVWAGNATNVTCTWNGSGNVRIDGDARARGANHTVSFSWAGRAGNALPTILVYVDSIAASDPFNSLDCREPNLTTVGVFDQRIVDDLKRYSVLRFLDWSAANSNPASVTWATRSAPDQLTQAGADGIALEHMIDLANATSSDAWFTVPWNADENYVKSMAKLVHDRLSADHRAYFELSNETWNFSFSQATQALNEGLSEHLSSDKYSNNLLRYAEKSTWMHKLLSTAFADKPTRLVRVLNMQNGNAWGVDQVMGFKDTAQWVDAIASAPYFGHDIFSGAAASSGDLPQMFAALEASRVKTLTLAVNTKAAAAKWNKRYIAYEGGQHIIPPASNAGAAMAAKMQRSPLMYDVYKRYLSDWKVQIGDTMTLYSATGAIGQYGAWGMREYGGQPISETPKRRAALEFAR